MENNFIIILIFLAIGTITGILSGLLGIGGGLFVVPALSYAFHLMGFPDILNMHMAVGTSFAIMVVTAGRSLLAHMTRAVEFGSIFKRLLPSVVIGTLMASTLAHYLDSEILRIIFAIFVLLMSLNLFFVTNYNSSRQLPGYVGINFMGFLIGAQSGLLGVGGGALSIPFLTYCNVPMRQALVISIALGLVIAVLGTLTFSLTGTVAGAFLPKLSTGYIYWPAWVGVGVGSLIFAPLGAKLSHRLPIPVLRRLFGTFLVMVGVHMLVHS